MKILSPLTNSNNVTLLKTISTESLIQDWEKHFQIDITEEFAGNKEIHLYECNETQLKFFSPTTVTGSSQLYQDLQKFAWYYMPHRWEHQVALNNLRSCHTVVEIGSACGDFVKAGREIGLEIRGIELNETAVLAAQEQNLPVDLLDLKTAAMQYRESLDAVCSFQVLEHVPNPRDFVTWSLQMLKPGGTLIYCVPNSESFLKYQYNLLNLPPHHMTLWSNASFKSLEHLFPIKLEKIIVEPLASYHTEGYLSAYKSYLCSKLSINRILLNRLTLYAYKRLLNAGLRLLLTGQCMYVQFRKT